MPDRSISIIVPLFNEASTVARLQDQLEPLASDPACEVLFIDGGSTDGTCSLIRPCFRVLHCEKGRARQMNAGACASTGDILFFLHCDSELPPDPLGEIRRVMRRRRAGCFGVSFDSANFFMFTCRLISNHRCRFRRIMFGDQGMFMERTLFFEAGMFPDLPIMEDYRFSLTLKEMGVPLGLTRRRIRTSARRFGCGSLAKLRTMAGMVRLRKMYRDGAPIDEIARRYRDVR